VELQALLVLRRQQHHCRRARLLPALQALQVLLALRRQQ
jgi:hypothetical protein